MVEGTWKKWAQVALCVGGWSERQERGCKDGPAETIQRRGGDDGSGLFAPSTGETQSVGERERERARATAVEAAA